MPLDLKSSMERFIEAQSLYDTYSQVHLKSSMERFIDPPAELRK